MFHFYRYRLARISQPISWIRVPLFYFLVIWMKLVPHLLSIVAKYFLQLLLTSLKKAIFKYKTVQSQGMHKFLPNKCQDSPSPPHYLTHSPQTVGPPATYWLAPAIYQLLNIIHDETELICLRQSVLLQVAPLGGHFVSVLGREEGYTVKYGLSPRDYGVLTKL